MPSPGNAGTLHERFNRSHLIEVMQLNYFI